MVWEFPYSYLQLNFYTPVAEISAVIFRSVEPFFLSLYLVTYSIILFCEQFCSVVPSVVWKQFARVKPVALRFMKCQTALFSVQM